MKKTKRALTSHFWEGKTLEQLTNEEWEALCDGCGQCCLYKIEDEESGDIYLTNVVCRFLDRATGICQVYDERHMAVPTCIQLNPHNVLQYRWIPLTCAYRLIAEGKPLPDWHPLITGVKSANKNGLLLGDRIVSESEVNMDDLESHVISLFSSAAD